MTDKITSQGRNNLDITQTRARAVDAPRKSESGAQGKRADAPQDAVELTDTATNLKRIEAQLAGTPEVDQSRVDELRQQVDDGSYEVDHEQIAQKMLRLDQDLV